VTSSSWLKSSTVDVAAVPNGHDEDNEHVVLYRVEHPVIACPDPMELVFTGQFYYPRRPGIGGKRFDRVRNPDLNRPLQFP
jgi:hypothetical protein